MICFNLLSTFAAYNSDAVISRNIRRTCCHKWKDAAEMFRKILNGLPVVSFPFVLWLSSFLPLPGFFTVMAKMEKCREARGEREGWDGRREKVPTSTVNDIIGTQTHLCLFSLISSLFLCSLASMEESIMFYVWFYFTPILIFVHIYFFWERRHLHLLWHRVSCSHSFIASKTLNSSLSYLPCPVCIYQAPSYCLSFSLQLLSSQESCCLGKNENGAS